MPRDPRAVQVLALSHPKGCRSYLIVDPTTRETCVVDPLLDRLAETLRLIGEAGARAALDRGHPQSRRSPLRGGGAPRENGGRGGHAPAAPAGVATHRPLDGDALPLGETEVIVHHAPGNSTDALVLEAPGALFTGDTLLIGTVGLQDAPGADADAWYETLHRIFDELPDETIIHPGHDDMGRTQSSLRQERIGNGWLRLEDREAFRQRFAADDRRVRDDAAALLAANREGLTRVPRDLEAASGLKDPAHATEDALKRGAAWTEAPKPPAAGWAAPPRPSSSSPASSSYPPRCSGGCSRFRPSTPCRGSSASRSSAWGCPAAAGGGGEAAPGPACTTRAPNGRRSAPSLPPVPSRTRAPFRPPSRGSIVLVLEPPR